MVAAVAVEAVVGVVAVFAVVAVCRIGQKKPFRLKNIFVGEKKVFTNVVLNLRNIVPNTFRRLRSNFFKKRVEISKMGLK